MALTATQRLQCKRHLGITPNSTVIDAQIDALELDSDKETELTTAIARCETVVAAIRTARDEADELVEGGGARFSYSTRVAHQKANYQEAKENLARIIGIDLGQQGLHGWRQS